MAKQFGIYVAIAISSSRKSLLLILGKPWIDQNVVLSIFEFPEVKWCR